MTSYEKHFLEAYYKAAYSSDAADWMNAALAAKQMYNQHRPFDGCDEEKAIQSAAQLKYEGA